MTPLPRIPRRGIAPDFEPVIVVDTREQDPLPITRFRTVRATLRSGDYSFAGGEEHFAIERKTVEDLVSCCAGENRERFERELHRLRGFDFARLLIIGTREQITAGAYRSQISPAAVLGSLNAWEVRYRVPVVFAPTVLDAVPYVEAWTWWYAREAILRTNRLVRGAMPVTSSARKGP